MTDADGLRFSIPANTGMGATLQWSSCTVDGVPSAAGSVSYELDITQAGGGDIVPLAQGLRDATRPLEIVSWTSGVAGTYELRARLLTAGAVCLFNVFIGGVDLEQPVVAGSVPTPGDASGALAVGAFDWSTGALAPYSSQGPTEDGRLKPELVAPASTTVSPGLAMVGTSASAPHVAGAAALLIERDRAAGQPSDPDAITAELESSALDVGPPGPDDETGYGRLRLDLTAPVVRPVWPAPGETVHGIVHPRLQVIEAGTIDSETMTLDGVALAPSLAEPRIDTRLAARRPARAATFALPTCPATWARSRSRSSSTTRPRSSPPEEQPRRRAAGSATGASIAVSVRDAGTGGRLRGRAPAGRR